MALTHDEVAWAVSQLYPGSQWSYDGDGSSLDPMYDADEELVSRGLEWHDDTKPAPTLDQLATYVTANPMPARVPDPFIPASVAVQTAVAAAMATVAITSPNLTAAQKTSIQGQVTAAVQAVVDESLPA